MRLHTTADLMNAAAAALARRDGHAFDKLLQINRDWLMDSTERDATEAALNAMQEAAYLLEDTPSQYDDGTEWDEDAA